MTKKMRVRLFLCLLGLGEVIRLAASALALLLGAMFVEVLLSVALYAANTEHAMSLIGYLYGENQDHVVLKFFLFLEGFLSLILLAVIVISSIIWLFVHQKKQLGVGSVLLVVLLIAALTVPIQRTRTMYAVKLTNGKIIVQGSPAGWETNYYPTKERAVEVAKAAHQDGWSADKIIMKKEHYYRPLISWSLPERPADYDNTD